MTVIDWVLLILIFAFVAALVLSVSAFSNVGAVRHVESRLAQLKKDDTLERVTAVRERYLRQLPPIEQALERLPGIDKLGALGVQAGRTEPTYRIVLLSLVLACVGATVAMLFLNNLWAALLAALVMLLAPTIKLVIDRNKRLATFEDQLPDALDLMSRALRAGSPLLEAFQFISEEMEAPLGVEFGVVWTYVNYGVTLDVALRDLVQRVPNMSLRTFVTAILVQRETGGNLAEILDRLSGTLRARAKFQRRLRTLTAEGRMSAVVLVLIPFVLAGALTVSSPEYLQLLLKDPTGHKLVIGAAGLMVLGIYWISRIIRVPI